jgi:hypothetical protein
MIDGGVSAHAQVDEDDIFIIVVDHFTSPNDEEPLVLPIEQITSRNAVPTSTNDVERACFQDARRRLKKLLDAQKLLPAMGDPSLEREIRVLTELQSARMNGGVRESYTGRFD